MSSGLSSVSQSSAEKAETESCSAGEFQQPLVRAERGVCLFGYQGEDHRQGDSSSKHYARCAIARQVL